MTSATDSAPEAAPEADHGSARDVVLARVRAALAPPTTDGASASAPVERPAVPRDYHHRREVPDPVGTFAERVAEYRATVTRTGPDGVAAAVSACLGDARRVVVPGGFEPAWVPPGLDVVADDPVLRADQLDAVDGVLTGAAVGVASTGTIVLDHTAGQGRRAVTLVPDLHVCVVRADQVVGDVPEGVERLQAAVDAGRPLTWISGPSATSDIELDRVEGVHGPRTLHVVLVDPGLDGGQVTAGSDRTPYPTTQDAEPAADGQHGHSGPTTGTS